jgi:hypothetical protein
MNNNISHLIHLLEINNIKLPNSINQILSYENSSKAQENNRKKDQPHALVAMAYPPYSWVLVLGYSHHMASS